MVVTSNHEVSAGVDVVLGVGSDVLLGDGGQHHLLHDVLPQGLQGHLLAVLAGHHHGVDPDGDAGSLLELVLAYHHPPPTSTQLRTYFYYLATNVSD